MEKLRQANDPDSENEDKEEDDDDEAFIAQTDDAVSYEDLIELMGELNIDPDTLLNN